MNKQMKKESAFTLIEIMIVLGILLILIVIVVPNMFRSKIVANETNAIAAMRTLATACNFYAMNKSDFPPDGPAGFQALYSGTPPYVNFDYSQALSSPKDGYYYLYVYPTGSSSFSIFAMPAKLNITGTRSFFVDSTGVIRYCSGAGQICTPNGESTALQ